MSHNHLVSIESIENAKNGVLEYKFFDEIKEVNSKEPIEAFLKLTNLGEFIEVSGNVKGTLILQCDVCLEDFEYKIDFDIDEMYAKRALSESYAQETEIKDGDFITDLNGAENIDIYDLLYQSVILNLPNKKVCGINCNGKEFLKQEDQTDPRMEVFKNIKFEDKAK
ncbi:MAG: DUF177 domain-containing protein [Brachyspira sp.]|nr:DUF177 domain-containing protein [Brachyspira sp.]